MTIAAITPSFTDLKRLMVKAASRRVPDRRLGKGATVAQSYVEEKARLLFLHALWTRVPATTAELLAGAPPTTLAGFVESRRTMPVMNPPTPSDSGPAPLNHPFLETQRQVDLALRDHISRWQARHHLPDPWIERAARFTLEMTNGSDPHAGPLLLDPADSCANVARPVPVVLSKGDAVLGEFDPKTETVDRAARRMLPELERRMRCALETIAEADRAVDGVVDPLAFDTLKGFERLVRFQVRSEHPGVIAENDNITERHVRREVSAIADLIGITLRPQGRGRPRRKTAHTMKVKPHRNRLTKN